MNQCEMALWFGVDIPAGMMDFPFQKGLYSVNALKCGALWIHKSNWFVELCEGKQGMINSRITQRVAASLHSQENGSEGCCASPLYACSRRCTTRSQE